MNALPENRAEWLTEGLFLYSAGRQLLDEASGLLSVGLDVHRIVEQALATLTAAQAAFAAAAMYDATGPGPL